LTQNRKNRTHWKRIDRTRENFIRRFTVRFTIAINKAGRPLRDAVKNAGSIEEITGALAQTPFNNDPLLSEMDKLYRIVGTFFVDAVVEDLKSEGMNMERKEVLDVSNEQLVMEIVDYIRREGATKVTSITATIRSMIQSELEKGVEKGLGIDEIKRNLRKRWNTLSHSRGKMIARTEVMTASSQASDVGAKGIMDTTGLRLRKIWLATPIGKYRTNHLALDGKGVAFESTFNVGGGVEMKHPHDPTAPAGEIINCRCSIRYMPLRP